MKLAVGQIHIFLPAGESKFRAPAARIHQYNSRDLMNGRNFQLHFIYLARHGSRHASKYDVLRVYKGLIHSLR